uniref:Uncharacterized protein n=1 Tax=Knipowitschia caucasica TaxID=637954 RepID=A0AAV2KWG8_KNICA
MLTEYPPPPEELSTLPASLGTFPPPPPENSYDPFQMRTPGKTLEERRSSLDAEIDSLTSILADLESSSPYKPRPAQLTSSRWADKACSGGQSIFTFYKFVALKVTGSHL